MKLLFILAKKKLLLYKNFENVRKKDYEIFVRV